MPQFEIDCPVCKGMDAACQDCAGAGVIEYHRCPNTMFGPEHVDIVRGAGLLEVGVLPASGGWADQAATWIDAVGVVRASIDEIDRKRRAKRD